MVDYYRPGYGKPGPIEPIARINEIMVVRRRQSWYRYRVVDLEAIVPSSAGVRDFAAGTSIAGGTNTTAGATLANNSLQNQLEMNDNELGQFRFKVLDDIRVQLWQLQQQPRWTSKRVRATLSLLSRINDPCGHLSEIYVHSVDYPSVDIINPGRTAILTARIAFWGFRYRVATLDTFKLDELEKIPGPYTAVVGEGF